MDVWRWEGGGGGESSWVPKGTCGEDIQMMKLEEFSPGQGKKKGQASRCPRHKIPFARFARGAGQKDEGLQGREPGVLLQGLAMVKARIAKELEQM